MSNNFGKILFLEAFTFACITLAKSNLSDFSSVFPGAIGNMGFD